MTKAIIVLSAIAFFLFGVLVFADVDTRDGTAITDATNLDGFTSNLDDADGQVIKAAAGATPACNAGCTSVADADQFCEDYQGTGTRCTGGDAWTESTSGNGAVDDDSTLNLASNTCSDKGEHVFDINITNNLATSQAFAYKDHGDDNIHFIYAQLYTDDISDLGAGEYASVFIGKNNGGATTAFALYVENDGGTFKWSYFVFETTNVYYSSTSVSEDTCYELLFEYDTTNNEQKLDVATCGGSLTNVISQTDSISNSAGRLEVGMGDEGGGAGDSFRIQYYVVKVDDDTAPTGCP